MASPRADVTRADRWLLGAWIALISIAVSGTVKDTDPYWQVRAGLETLDGVPLARPDTWSWAPVDGLFYPNSPAWNVLLALAWRAAGWWGLYAVTVATVAGTLTLLWLLARRLGARPVPMVATLLLTAAAVLPALSSRATLAAMALFLLAVLLAAWWAPRAGLRASWVNAAVALVSGFLLSWVGNWIHLSWSTFAVATAASWATVWLLTAGLARGTRAWLVVGGSAGLGLGVLLGPYGTDVTTRTAVVVSATRGVITEWVSPFDPHLGYRWWPLSVVLVVVVAATASWVVRAARTPPLDPRLPLVAALTIVALPSAVASLVYVRFVTVTVFVLAPVVGAAVTALGKRAHTHYSSPPAGAGILRRRLEEWTGERFWRVVLWSVLVVLAPLGLLLGSQHTVPTTQAAIDRLPEGCRLFSGSTESAAVILTRPDVPVWIDGRADYWGRPRILEAQGYLYDGSQQTVVPPGTTCVLLSGVSADPGLAAIIAALDADSAWVRLPETGGAHVWLPVEPSVP